MKKFRRFKVIICSLPPTILHIVIFLTVAGIYFAVQNRQDLAASVFILALVTFVLELPKTISDCSIKSQTIAIVNLETCQLIVALHALDDYYLEKGERSCINNKVFGKEFTKGVHQLDIKELNLKYLPKIMALYQKKRKVLKISDESNHRQLQILIEILKGHLSSLETLPIRYNHQSINYHTLNMQKELESLICALRMMLRAPIGEIFVSFGSEMTRRYNQLESAKKELGKFKQSAKAQKMSKKFDSWQFKISCFGNIQSTTLNSCLREYLGMLHEFIDEFS